MQLINKKSASVAVVGALASALVLSGTGSALAGTTKTVTIREGALDKSESRTAGHVEFLKDGLAVYTDDASSQAKAAGYFAMDKALSDITNSSLKWHGTDLPPGQQIVFDVDGVTGNGNDRNILVGEPAYKGNWWLTNGSSDDAKAADPSGDENGGNGTEFFGTLDEWSSAMPDARVFFGGFSLGSGVKGNGVISSITYGDTEYVFTNTAPEAEPTKVDVTGFSSKKVSHSHARVTMTSVAKPANAVTGKRLHWKISVDGKRVFATKQQFGDRDVWVQRFARNSGAHRVELFKNGVQVRNFMVRTGHTK